MQNTPDSPAFRCNLFVAKRLKPVGFSQGTKSISASIRAVLEWYILKYNRKEKISNAKNAKEISTFLCVSLRKLPKPLR